MSGIDDAILESEERAEYDKTEDAEVYPFDIKIEGETNERK